MHAGKQTKYLLNTTTNNNNNNENQLQYNSCIQPLTCRTVIHTGIFPCGFLVVAWQTWYPTFMVDFLFQFRSQTNLLQPRRNTLFTMHGVLIPLALFWTKGRAESQGHFISCSASSTPDVHLENISTDTGRSLMACKLPWAQVMKCNLCIILIENSGWKSNDNVLHAWKVFK